MSKIISEQNPAVYHSNKYDADQMIKRVAMILAIVSFLVGGVILLMYQQLVSTPDITVTEKFELTKFESNDEFQQYFEEAQKLGNTAFMPFMAPRAVTMEATGEFNVAQDMAMTAQESAPTRVSETNVQVAGIDEPDIVKTDGNTIFFSRQPLYYIMRGGIEPAMPLIDEASESRLSIMPPPDIPNNESETTFIDALPVEEISEIASIDKQGDLLLYNNTLIVLSGNNIYGYDVSVPSAPKQIWDMQFDNSYIQTARLLNNKLYIISNQYISSGVNCPIALFKRTGANTVTVPCTDIYHPSDIIAAESTYTVMSVEPATGVVNKRISFVGSANSSNVYVSPNNIYVAYQTSTDLSNLYFDFFVTEGQGLLPTNVLTQLQQLQGYDLSPQTKFSETQIILDKYKQSLSSADRIVFEQNFQNKLSIYVIDRMRDITSTAIARIDTNDLEIKAGGKVPGFVLNQFSMDEYQGNFRIATTSQAGFGSDASVNDLYVLDSNLSILGRVQDLGLGERIYSVRFMQDQAYVVTFKQIDPFYVINLKDPNNPKKTGELKIPGFSSYLHPLGSGRILGVGKEDGLVKLSLFDVSNPSSPEEITKFTLSDYHSEVIDNHRAFLNDPDHKVFFIPGSQSGYIFSYESDRLELVQAIPVPQTKRALFINDYLYVISEGQINVYNENNWEEVNNLSL